MAAAGGQHEVIVQLAAQGCSMDIQNKVTIKFSRAIWKNSFHCLTENRSGKDS